jgi:hypothetical protein
VTYQAPAPYSYVEESYGQPPAAQPSSGTGFVVPAFVVAMCAVAGYSIGTRAVTDELVETKPSAAPLKADVSKAMGEVQHLIAEMTSSPAALKATLEKSSHLQELASRDPEVAAALNDPALLEKEMNLLTTMNQMLRGMQEAIADPMKNQAVKQVVEERAGQFQRTFAGPRRSRAPAPVMQFSQLTEINKKNLLFDQDGLFEGREVAQTKPPVKLLNRINDLRVLTSIADAGLLTKAQESGVFSKLESVGAFGLIEKTLPIIDDLGLLGTLEDLLNIPANVQVLAALALLAGEAAFISGVPDDNVALIAVQVLSGVLAGGGAVTLLASAYFFSLLQGDTQ